MSVQKQSASEQIQHLPEAILFDMARNESAVWEFRKAAASLLLDKRYKKADHPDLFQLVAEIKSEQALKDEVESIVEAAIEQPIPTSGPFRASITTQTMQQPDGVDNAPVVRNPLALTNDALGDDGPNDSVDKKDSIGE